MYNDVGDDESESTKKIEPSKLLDTENTGLDTPITELNRLLNFERVLTPVGSFYLTCGQEQAKEKMNHFWQLLTLLYTHEATKDKCTE